MIVGVMVSEVRINEISKQLIDLDGVIVVTPRVARAVAEVFPSGTVDAPRLWQTLRDLEKEDKVEILDFSDGEFALE